MGQNGLNEYASSKVNVLLANKTRERFSKTAILPFGHGEMWDPNNMQPEAYDNTDLSNLDSRATGSFYHAGPG